MLKIMPKMLSGISHNFHPLCSFSVPKLATFVTIILKRFNQEILYQSISLMYSSPLYVLYAYILCTHHCAIATPMMYRHLGTGGL